MEWHCGLVGYETVKSAKNFFQPHDRCLLLDNGSSTSLRNVGKFIRLHGVHSREYLRHKFQNLIGKLLLINIITHNLNICLSLFLIDLLKMWLSSNNWERQ
jgi:hypothetical protein